MRAIMLETREIWGLFVKHLEYTGEITNKFYGPAINNRK